MVTLLVVLFVVLLVEEEPLPPRKVSWNQPTAASTMSISQPTVWSRIHWMASMMALRMVKMGSSSV